MAKSIVYTVLQFIKHLNIDIYFNTFDRIKTINELKRLTIVTSVTVFMYQLKYMLHRWVSLKSGSII